MISDWTGPWDQRLLRVSLDRASTYGLVEPLGARLPPSAVDASAPLEATKE